MCLFYYTVQFVIFDAFTEFQNPKSNSFCKILTEKQQRKKNKLSNKHGKDKAKTLYPLCSSCNGGIINLLDLQKPQFIFIFFYFFRTEQIFPSFTNCLIQYQLF